MRDFFCRWTIFLSPLLDANKIKGVSKCVELFCTTIKSIFLHFQISFHKVFTEIRFEMIKGFISPD